jgi:signal transduction histidine kinase
MVRGRAVSWDAAENLAASQLRWARCTAPAWPSMWKPTAPARSCWPCWATTCAARCIRSYGGHGAAAWRRRRTASTRIQASSTRMERLISQVLDMSRINGWGSA